MSKITDQIKDLAERYFEEVRDVRRHLHMHPELSFEEHQTSAYLADQLQKEGIEFHKGVAGTGIVGIIGNGDGPVVALRGDMDALPINEQNDVSYKSKNEGVMHACGHDVHSSCLLGAARILKSIENELPGRVKLIFQPGEERIPGGASKMIEEGVLEKPDVQLIFGQHVYPDLEAGHVGMCPGMYMASADEIYLTIKGKGGHGGMPHKNIDPVLIAAQVITGLQQVVSRRCPPSIPSVLSFGKIQGNGATNVIPDEVYLEGTFRTMNEEWRKEAHQIIRSIIQSTVEGMGGTIDLDLKVGYPFLVNHDDLTAQAFNAAKAYLGEDYVHKIGPRMTAEDFAYFSQKIPACFYRLGTSDFEAGIDKPVHNNRFNIDEEALKTGMGMMAWLAFDALNNLSN